MGSQLHGRYSFGACLTVLGCLSCCFSYSLLSLHFTLESFSWHLFRFTDSFLSHVQSTDEPTRGILYFCHWFPSLVFSFWFFLRGSISLPKLPICSCMVPTFSIRTLNILTSYFKFLVRGTSLVVQWLRIHLPMQGTWVQSLVKKLRSHMPWGGKVRMLQRRAHRTQPRPRKNEDLVQPKVNQSTDKFPVW